MIPAFRGRFLKSEWYTVESNLFIELLRVGNTKFEDSKGMALSFFTASNKGITFFMGTYSVILVRSCRALKNK